MKQNASVALLHDNKDLPIYAQPDKLLSTQECVTVLLNSDLKDCLICNTVPFAVEINSVFVLDLNKLKSPSDVICDDMGVWKWGGSCRRWLAVDEQGFVSFLEEKDEELENCYLVWKRRYSLKTSPDVKRMIVMLEGWFVAIIVLATM